MLSRLMFAAANTDAEVFLAALEEQIGCFTRPIRAIHEVEFPVGFPFSLNYAPLNPMAFPPEARLQEGFVSAGWGRGWTQGSARIGALAEAIERYSAIWDGTEDLRIFSLEEAGSKVVRPEQCMLFGPEQIARGTAWPQGITGSFDIVPAPLPDDEPIEWVPAISVTTGNERLVAAALVYYGFRGRGNAYACPDGSGSAAGTSFEDAVFRALCENIERDAVGIWWFNRVVRPAIDIDQIGGKQARALVDWLDGTGRETWVLDITTDLGIPAFVALSGDKGEPYRRMLFGFGAHPSATRALDAALLEMCQNIDLVCGGVHSDNHEAMWEVIEARKPAYLRPGPDLPARRYAELNGADSEQRAACLLACRKAGLEVLAVDLTREKIGVPIVRVIVPGLRGIRRRTAPGRLYDVPVAMGWRDEPLDPRRLNPLPLLT